MTWRRVLNITKWVVGVVVALMLLISALLLVFKDNIKSYAIEEANQYINKRVHISYFDVSIWKTFPNLTLSFDNVLIYSKFDTLQTKDTAIYAQKIDLKFNPLDFFKGKYNIRRIDIKNGEINLKIQEDGTINYDFLKPSEDTVTSPFNFNLEEINLLNTHFTYSNLATQQYYSGLFHDLKFHGSFNEKQFTLMAKTNFDIQSIRSKSIILVQNQKAKCDIEIQMDQINHIFEIKSADVSINELPFFVKGKVSNDSLDFYIGAKDVNLEDVANNFTFQGLDVVNKIHGKGKVNFELFIKGENKTTSSPAIYSNFDIKNGSLSDQGFSLSQINLKGNYSNGANDGNEHITLSKVHFYSLNQNFDGHVKVTDFDKPRLRGEANGVLNLNAIYRLFGPFSMEQLSGDVKINGKFDLRLNDPKYNPKNITLYNINTSLSLNNIVAQFQGDNRVIKLNNGDITINNQLATFSQLSVTINQSSLIINGNLNRFVDYFNNENGILFVEGNVESKSLFLDDLYGNKVQTDKKRSWVIPDNIKGNFNIDLNKVVYSGHEYTAIKSQLIFDNHQLVFPKLEGVNAGTRINGSLKITEERPMYLVVEAILSSNNVNFKSLFKEWNNFDQNVITSENIQGRATILLNFKGPFDLYNEEIIKKDFDVRAYVRIDDGALTNVQAFKEITKSLHQSAAKLLISKSKTADFEKKLLNLKFDSFENEFTIKDGVITIPKMIIRSNALDVGIEGTQTFENEINYSFNFRFREIKGGKGSEFGDVVDDGTGFRIYLKMYGTMEHPIFEWDKEAKQAEKAIQNEQAKEDLKSALKSGFGINKKDSTIQGLQNKTHREDKVILDFGDDNGEKDEQTEKEDGKIKQKINKWKKESQNEKPKVEFEVEDPD